MYSGRSSDEVKFLDEVTLTSDYNDNLSNTIDLRSYNQLTLFLKYTATSGDFANVLVEYYANGSWYQYGRWMDGGGANLEYQLKPFKVVHGVNSYVAINETTAPLIRLKAMSSTGGTMSVFGSYFAS